MLKRWAARLLGVRWLTGGIAALGLGLAIVWVLFVPATDWLAHHDIGSVTGQLRETALDNARGRLLTLGAGLFAVGALVFTARNFTLSREGQVTDRYTKAIEQLGSEKLDVRIGGIYALERIARDSVRDHPTVMEVLAAFIREHSREQSPMPKEGSHPDRSWTTRPDVQAALTVVGRRDAERDIRRLDLARADLTGANLTWAHLGATLTRGGNAVKIAGANLAGAKLSGATLTRANLKSADLGGADLTHADLSYALLTGANVGGADLTSADVTYAWLTDADLAGANLTRARLTHAVLFDSNVSGADLTGADLTGAVLGDTNVSGANFSEANLSDANLGGMNFTGAKLGGANLTRVFALQVDLTSADLRGANLSKARLMKAKLTDAHLDGSTLDGAYLSPADLRGADLTGADLGGADLTLADLTRARWPRDTPVPEGWRLDTNSGLLDRADTSSGSAEAY